MCKLSATLRRKERWWLTYHNMSLHDVCDDGLETCTMTVKSPSGDVETTLSREQVTQYPTSGNQPS